MESTKSTLNGIHSEARSPGQRNNLIKSSDSFKSTADDSEVLLNIQDELDSIRRKISGGGEEPVEEESIWKRKEPTSSEPKTSTLVRRPRSERSATVCVTQLPNNNNNCSMTSSIISDSGAVNKSEEGLDSNVMRQYSLKELSTKSFGGSKRYNSASSNATNKSSTVKNFVQSFERLKDLSYSSSVSHSPADLFPAHRSALASKDSRTVNSNQAPRYKYSSKQSSSSSLFGFNLGNRDNEIKTNGTDSKHIVATPSQNDQSKTKTNNSLKSRQNSLTKNKVIVNTSDAQNSSNNVRRDSQGEGSSTLTRTRGVSVDRRSERSYNGSTSFQHDVNVCPEEPRVGSSSPYSCGQPRRWTMTKQGKDSYNSNNLHIDDGDSFSTRHSSFSGFNRLARAASLSKFDDDDEYLQSPPIHGTSTPLPEPNKYTAGQSHQAGYRKMFRLPILQPSTSSNPYGYIHRAGHCGMTMPGGTVDKQPPLYSMDGPGVDSQQSQFATLRHPGSARHCKPPHDLQLNHYTDRERGVTFDYSPTAMNHMPPASAMTKEMQAIEIRRLRQDLQWAKEQVNLLTTKLSNNANVVEAFDRSLVGISQRLLYVAANSQNKDAELGELLRTVEGLRLQNFNLSGANSARNIQGAHPCQRANGQEYLTRQASQDSVHSLESSAASVFSNQSTSEQTDHFSKKNTVKNWLRSSFGKAFSRRKNPHKSAGEPEFSYMASNTSNVSHANSMPSISTQNPETASMNSAFDEHGVCSYKVPQMNGDRHHPGYSKAVPSSSHGLLHTSSISALPPTLERMGSVRSCSNSIQSMGHPREGVRLYSDSCVNTKLAQRRNDSLDHKAATSPLEILSKSMERCNTDVKKLPVSVALSPETNFSKQLQERETSVIIGSVNVCSSTTWDALDSMIRRVFQEYLIRIDPNTSLGLNGQSVYSYIVGEINRTRGSASPELLPIGYLVGDVTSIKINLKGNSEKSDDLLAFETLIPKSFIQRYLKLLMEHRRVILSGSSGTGKTYLAQRLAECLVARSQPEVTPESIAIFRVDSQSSKELRQYLSNMADRCENGRDKLPYVVILDNLHHISSMSDVFSGYLDAHYHNSPYIIGTMNQATCSSTDLQLHHNFRWVLYANHIEPVRTFLGRHLRRQLIPVEVNNPVDNELSKVIDWLPKVWQHINKFLEVHSSCDITIGPRLFLSCPMDASRAQVWFNDLWNYSIVPYLLEAVREGIQVYGCRAPWEDLADWIVASYPWTKQCSKPSLLRLRPEDVGYDCSSVSPVRETSGSEDATSGACASSKPETDSTLMDILMRLQEAAIHSDSDTNSTDGHSQSERREGRQSKTPSLSDTNSNSSQCTIAEA